MPQTRSISEHDRVNLSQNKSSHDSSNREKIQSDSKPIPTIRKILFLDLETDSNIDLKKNRNGYYTLCNIAQLGWQLRDSDDGFISHEGDCLIKPSGYILHQSDYHKITMEEASKSGMPITEALNGLLEAIRMADSIVTYNTDFDLKILQNHFNRYTTMDQGKFPQLSNSAFCMMIHMANKYNHRKWLKLDRSYRLLMGKDMSDAHNALWDTIHLSELYFKERLGITNIPEYLEKPKSRTI